MGSAPSPVVDYGCGTGSTSPFLLNLLHAEKVVGLDPSIRSVEVARRGYGSERMQFFALRNISRLELRTWSTATEFFITFLRWSVAQQQFIQRTLHPGGLFSLWENNPWNPGTQYVMARLPFDRDAIKLNTIESRRLVRSAGLSVLRTDFLFFFPRFLKILRPVEKFVAALPLGAQYQILSQRSIA
jgi:SAM-dependent methyltransferase